MGGLFTERANKVMSLGKREARLLGHAEFDVIHLLMGMLAEEEGVAGVALKRFGLTLDGVRSSAAALKSVPLATGKPNKQLPMTKSVKEVIEGALDECRSLKHNYPGTEHLLLALCRQPGESVMQIFSEAGVTPDQLYDEVLLILGHSR